MKIDNVSFTSKINIVPESFFYKLPYDETHIDICMSNDIIKKVQNSNIWTDGIRTCTAGAVINTKTKEAAGFHFYDYQKAFQHISDYVKELLELVPGADRALILGGKDLKSRKYSMKNFLELKKALLNKIPNITTFEKHKIPNSESNILYSASNDEWFINTLYSKKFIWEGNNVMSKEELLENFEKIELAKGDTLFINEKQIIL